MRIRVEVGALAILEIMRRDQARRWGLMGVYSPSERTVAAMEIMHQMMDRRLSVQDAEQGVGIFTREHLLLGRLDEPQQQG